MPEWDAWDYHQIRDAVIGKDGAWTNVQALHAARGRLTELHRELGATQGDVLAERRRLIGDGDWAGSAADAFDVKIRGIVRMIRSNLDRLGQGRGWPAVIDDLITVTETSTTAMYNLDYQGAWLTKARYDELVAAGQFAVPAWNIQGGRIVYNARTYPDIFEWMTGQARVIIAGLAWAYRAAKDDLEMREPVTELPPAAALAEDPPSQGGGPPSPDLGDPTPSPDLKNGGPRLRRRTGRPLRNWIRGRRLRSCPSPHRLRS
ncbi:hypothetical protein ACFQZ4_43210 [Catellatospora coxensis]